jgi:hypothetical protein
MLDVFKMVGGWGRWMEMICYERIKRDFKIPKSQNKNKNITI